LKSSDARRNSAMLLPSERLSCGSLRGPKKIRAMAKMNSSSVLPSDSRISKTTFRKFLSVVSKRRTVRNDCNLQPYKAEIYHPRFFRAYESGGSCVREKAA